MYFLMYSDFHAISLEHLCGCVSYSIPSYITRKSTFAKVHKPVEVIIYHVGKKMRIGEQTAEYSHLKYLHTVKPL